MNRPRRIVFLSESPHTKRDHERFGIALLESRGARVEVWDLTSVLQPRLAADYRPPDPFSWPGLRTFASRREALAAIAALGEDDFVISHLAFEPAAWDAYRALSKSRAPYAIMSGGNLPAPKGPRPPLTPARVFNALYMRAPMRALGLRPAALAIFVGGESASRTRHPIGRGTEELWCHGYDYDLYLAAKDGAARDGTAVFLDEYVPFHPDYLRRGHEPYSTAERYYPALRRFFDAFERATGLTVVVAAHPRSSYEKHPDYFGGRRAVRGRTVEMVRDSDAVIAHSSTAIAYAVLFRKPVVLTASADLRACPDGPLINAMALSLDKRLLDLDHPDEADWKAAMTVDEKAYEAFRRRYVKKDGTPEKPFWDIVADRLGLPETRS